MKKPVLHLSLQTCATHRLIIFFFVTIIESHSHWYAFLESLWFFFNRSYERFYFLSGAIDAALSTAKTILKI